MAQKIATFDDWTYYFNKWQKDIGFDSSRIDNYKFDAFCADPPHGGIGFGELKGRKNRKSFSMFHSRTSVMP